MIRVLNVRGVQFFACEACTIVQKLCALASLQRTVFGDLAKNLPAVRRASAPQLALAAVVPVPKTCNTCVSGVGCRGCSRPSAGRCGGPL